MKVQELLIEALINDKERYKIIAKSPIYSICDIINELYIDGHIKEDEKFAVNILLKEHFKTIDVGYYFKKNHNRIPTFINLNLENNHKSCNVFHWKVDNFYARVKWIKDNINF